MDYDVLYQRWHDKDPLTSYMVQQLKILPEESLSILSHVMIRFIETDAYLQPNLEKNLKQLGKDKIMAINKSQRRQRWYDQHTMTRELFKNLYILDLEQRRYVAKSVQELITLIQVYHSQCKLYNRKPQSNHLTYITQMYLILRKPDEVKKFLKNVQAEFEQAGPPAPPTELALPSPD